MPIYANIVPSLRYWNTDYFDKNAGLKKFKYANVMQNSICNALIPVTIRFLWGYAISVCFFSCGIKNL